MLVQVCGVLARMEAVGMAVDDRGLAERGAAVRARMAELSRAASGLLGGAELNLGSAAQLATALYEQLRLPPPALQGADAGASAGARWVAACARVTA